MTQADHISRTSLSASATTHIVQDGLSATTSVLLPVLAQTFGLNYAQVGLLRGVKSFTQAVVEMGSGWLSERWGECQLLAAGLALTGIGYFFMAIAPSLAVVTFGLLVVGVGTALHHAPSSALIATNYPSGRRSSALGVYNASGDVGKLAFSGGFSFAIGIGFAWFQVSLWYAVCAIIAALAIVFISKEIRSLRRVTKQSEADTAANGDLGRWGILNWRLFSMLLAAICIDNMVQTSVLVFMAFLMLFKGLPLWLATGATVLLLAGGVVGKAVCGYLADRLGVRTAFTLIQVLTALGLATIVIAPNWLALTLLIPLGAVVQGSTSITYGFAAELIHPDRMARGYALLYASGSFTAAAGPPLFGILADGQGISMAIYAMAVATLLAIPLIFMLPAKTTKAD